MIKDNNNIKVHQVRYKNGGFYLTIDILILVIFKIINDGNGESKLHKKIRLIDNDLPIEHVFKIPTITIFIRLLIEKNNKFYLELSLNHSLYEINV